MSIFQLIESATVLAQVAFFALSPHGCESLSIEELRATRGHRNQCVVRKGRGRTRSQICQQVDQRAPAGGISKIRPERLERAGRTKTIGNSVVHYYPTHNTPYNITKHNGEADR